MFVFDDLARDRRPRHAGSCCARCRATSCCSRSRARTRRSRQKIFKNMSQRAAEMLKDDLEAKGPVRLSEVEAAQKEILLAGPQAGRSRHDPARRQGRGICLSRRVVALGPARGRRHARAAAPAPRASTSCELDDCRARRLASTAYEKGHVEGVRKRRGRARTSASTEVDVKVAALEAISARWRKPLEELDIAGRRPAHAARADHRQAPGAPRAARSIPRRSSRSSANRGLLPLAARDIRVHLHPEDAAIVREKLARADGRAGMEARRRSAHGARRLPRDHGQFAASTRASNRASPRSISALLGDDRANAPQRRKRSTPNERRDANCARNAQRGWAERMARQVRARRAAAVAAGGRRR